jgi:hypothetical protein
LSVLGPAAYGEIVGRHGYREVTNIPSLEKARAVYRELLDSFRARFSEAMRALGADEYGKILGELCLSPSMKLTPEQAVQVFNTWRKRSMPDNERRNSSSATAEVDPKTLASTLTLFQVEQSLVFLAESAEEEVLTPELEQALVRYMGAP